MAHLRGAPSAARFGPAAGRLAPCGLVHRPFTQLGQRASCAGNLLRQIAQGATVQCRRRRATLSTRPRAMFGGLGKLLKGDPTEATRRKYQPTVDIINGFEPQMEGLTDEALRAKTAELKGRVQAGESLDDILPEAFAVVREASRRVLGLRPFDVQLIGGILLHEGQIAEMRTGEGKTLVAVLPAFLNALSGGGVHVVTVNDYLARRDSEYVGQVHRFLGLKVGLIQASMKPEERSAAYSCDVTYVTNSELGFDYLRDNLAQTKNDLVLSEFNFCIIDEVDSILIDEARTPLIISGPADKPSEKYIKASQIADAMGRDVHYTIDEKQRSALLTEDGYEAAEDILQVVDLYDPREQWAAYLINAIKAKELFQKDVNYIIRNDEIIIVDEFTGRTMPGRRWSEGLHQAVEAKEGVTIQKESVTLASISYQNFFRTFPKLSGMTGTAATEASEFANIYDLQVAVVPTNMPVARADNTDVVFRNLGAKWGAVVQEIVRVHKQGRPMLVGTTSVENSELLSSMLVEAGIKHQVLNAKPENVERESEIVAQTGRKGAVTLATNMAGRGTDIVLGGNPSFMARLKMREMLMPCVVASVDEDGKPVKAKWKVSMELFPCELSEDTVQRAKQAVELAESTWGSKALPVLEAEDRLSVACEKAPTSDKVTAALREAYVAMEAEYEAVTAQEKEEVKGLGGLYVIGTERHESRRIDNQLRGRCGRQGDPGATRYFLSLEDNLFRIFGGDRIQSMMNAFNVGDLPIESGMLTDALDNAQKKVESYFFDIRKQLFDYDQVLNTQRDRIYAQRRKALVADDLNPIMVEFAEKTMDDILEANIPASTPLEEWSQKVPVLVNKIKQYCPLLEALKPELVMEVSGGSDYEAMRGYLRKQAVDAYKEKYQFVEDFEKGLMQDAQRFFLLTQTDNLWKEHLQAINFLRQAVGLRGYGQRDPLTEYKLEGFNLFVETMAQIRRNVVYNVYIFQPVRLQRKDGEEGEPTQQQQQQQQQQQTQSTAA